MILLNDGTSFETVEEGVTVMNFILIIDFSSFVHKMYFICKMVSSSGELLMYLDTDKSVLLLR